MLHNKVKVVDNVLPPADFKLIQETVLNYSFPFRYNPSSAYRTEAIKTKEEQLRSGSFATMLYKSSENFNEVEYTQIINPLLVKAVHNCSIRISELLRVRVGLHVYNGDAPFINDAHIDADSPHYVGLLYLEDSDGDTFLYNEQFDYNSEINGVEYSEGLDLTVKERVTPKANRLLLFDGSYYHASSTPTSHSTRTTINFNFI